MANLLPTKGNLIAAKRSRTLARTGYELMDRKRNILIRELMGMIDTAKELQGQIDAVFTEAYTALQAANIRLGICDRIAEAVDVDDSLTLRYRSVMGVELPRIPGQSPPPRPEYGMGDTCSELDECYLKFYRVKELTRRLAEVETSIYRLADAIKKTQKREKVFIGNMVKCRPPQNRDPLNIEQEACIGYLRNQVALLKPKIIVCLGRIAAMKLIKEDFKITRELGQWIEKAGVWMMAMYHPSALLRDPRKRPESFEDLKSLQAKIREVCVRTY